MMIGTNRGGLGGSFNFTMDDFKSNLHDIDEMLVSLENKPFERMAKLEQEKLKIVQES